MKVRTKTTTNTSKRETIDYNWNADKHSYFKCEKAASTKNKQQKWIVNIRPADSAGPFFCRHSERPQRKRSFLSTLSVRQSMP